MIVCSNSSPIGPMLPSLPFPFDPSNFLVMMMRMMMLDCQPMTMRLPQRSLLMPRMPVSKRCSSYCCCYWWHCYQMATMMMVRPAYGPCQRMSVVSEHCCCSHPPAALLHLLEQQMILCCPIAVPIHRHFHPQAHLPASLSATGTNSSSQYPPIDSRTAVSSDAAVSKKAHWQNGCNCVG